MKNLATSFPLGSLVMVSCLPLVVTSPNTLAIPKRLREAVGKVIINATACTVTCGLGYKEETVCEVGPDGVRRNCTSQRLECLTNWICGMLHFTVLTGEQFELSCLSPEILEVGQEAFRFTWRLARGIISTNDEVFRPFRAHSYFVKFLPAQEYDSGTYRCDVQLLKNLKFVKRLYFGLRVLPPNLVNLNFYQSLTDDQKLVGEGLEVNLTNHSMPHHPSWKKKVASAVGIGITFPFLLPDSVSPKGRGSQHPKNKWEQGGENLLGAVSGLFSLISLLSTCPSEPDCWHRACSQEGICPPSPSSFSFLCFMIYWCASHLCFKQWVSVKFTNSFSSENIFPLFNKKNSQ